MTAIRKARRWTLAAIAALLAACAAPLPAPRGDGAAGSGPADFPRAWYEAQRARGASVYRVDPARSEVTIVVRRGGAFPQLGHDHVVASRDVAGYVAPDDGRADFYLPLDTLVVDEPALRARAGLTTQPDADDIAGTYRNMRRGLEADRYPYVVLRVDGAPAPPGPVRLAVTLHGATRDLQADARWTRSADDFAIEGSFALLQSEFGMTPLTVLGGAIAVQDRVEVAFRIVARRL